MTPDQFADLSDFYLCLSRAFLAPEDDATFAALGEDLGPDLADLAGSLGYDVAPVVTAYGEAIAEYSSRHDLLIHYSRLFLTPPVPAHLNAGLHFDGVPMGPSVARMEEAYRRNGVDRAATFHDLPDHLSLQCEFVAVLARRAADAAAAGEDPGEIALEIGLFLRDLVAAWLPWLVGRIAAETGAAPSPYFHLAHIAAEASAADARRLAPAAEAPALASRRTTRAESVIGPAETAVKCRDCGEPLIRDKQMRKLEEIMAARGMATEHLDVCPACRDGRMGFERRVQKGQRMAP